MSRNAAFFGELDPVHDSVLALEATIDATPMPEAEREQWHACKSEMLSVAEYVEANLPETTLVMPMIVEAN